MTFHQLKKIAGDISPNCFIFLAGEKWIISVLGTIINIHSYSTGALIKSYEYHSFPIISISVLDSKNNLDLFSFDESGLIKCVNLRTESIIFSFHLRESIKDGLINKKMKKIYYTTKNKENSLNIFNFFNNEINQISSEIEKTDDPIALKYHGLKSSVDENFVIEYLQKSIIIYDLIENKIINNIKHDNFITIVDLNHDNSILAVGDVIGKIYLYYKPLTTNQEKIKSSKFHWHCNKVISLKFNAISNVLLSGGYENVLVMWYYLESKKNFCPRLSAPILNIFTNADETIFFLILQDNSIEMIKSTNFLQCGSLKFVTNPLIHNSDSEKRFFKSGIIQHPTQNVHVMNGLPGDIQYIDVIPNKKVSSFKVVRRHLTAKVGDINPDPLEVTNICFDSTGKIMVTSVKRHKNEQNEKNSLSSLYFWEELNLFDYHLNTRVDNIHGEEINGIVNFLSKNEKSEEIFVTYGSDNKFKLWKQFIKEKSNKFNGNKKSEMWNNENNSYKEEQTQFFWNCFYETDFKNNFINDLCYFYDETKKSEFLCLTIQNGFALWNINSFDFGNVIETHNYNGHPISNFKILPCQNEQLLIIYDEKQMIIYSMKKETVLININFPKIIQILVYNETCIALIEYPTEGKIISTILKICLKEFTILKSLFLINPLKEIFLKIENNKFFLIGVEQTFNFLIIETNSTDIFYDNSCMEVENEEISNINSLWMTKKKEDGEETFDNYYLEITKKIKLENNKQFELFNSNSNFIPKISLLYDNYMERLLLKTEEEKNEEVDEVLDNKKSSFIEDVMELEEENENPKSIQEREYVKELYAFLKTDMNK